MRTTKMNHLRTVLSIQLALFIPAIANAQQMGVVVRDTAAFISPTDTIDETCIAVLGNEVGPVTRDGRFLVTGVPVDQGPVRLLVQCALPDHTIGQFSDPIPLAPNAVVDLGTFVNLDDLPP